MEKRPYLRPLIEEMMRKTGSDSTFKGFESMAEALNIFTKDKITFTAKYLKYNLYEGKTSSKAVRESKLDIIAEFATGKKFRAFVAGTETETDPVLQSVVGNYYCFVRVNQEKGELLRSPVRISKQAGRMSYELRGGRLNYEGELIKTEGCLFVLMKSIEDDKSFYHVYRIGKRKKPEVLQGIFSGVSTDFSPIGGRAVLIRAKEPFQELKTKKIDLDKLRSSNEPIEQRLAGYFEKRETNNLSIDKPQTFEFDDLNRK